MKPRLTARSFQSCWSLILLLLALALAACASVRSTLATVEPGIRLTLTMANAPGSRLTQTAQRIPTRYVTITPTPRPPPPSPKPTATPVWTVTPIPASSSEAVWAVEAVEVKGWPADSHMQFLSWDSNASVGVDGYFMVDVVSAVVVTPIPASTPTTFRSIPGDNLTLSPDGFYAIECADDGLRLYHIASNRLLSQTNVHSGWCESVDWSEDSSVASVVSDDGRVYVWSVDGSPPNEVGHAMPFSAARWSPDSKRLVLVNFSSVGADWASFSIIYRDGKPALDKGADFEAGNGWEPTFVGWLTNDIVTNYRQCGFMCNYVEYYDADTGRYLTTQMDSFTQTASRSPDKR